MKPVVKACIPSQAPLPGNNMGSGSRKGTLLSQSHEIQRQLLKRIRSACHVHERNPDLAKLVLESYLPEIDAAILGAECVGGCK